VAASGGTVDNTPGPAAERACKPISISAEGVRFSSPELHQVARDAPDP